MPASTARTSERGPRPPARRASPSPARTAPRARRREARRPRRPDEQCRADRRDPRPHAHDGVLSRTSAGYYNVGCVRATGGATIRSTPISAGRFGNRFATLKEGVVVQSSGIRLIGGAVGAVAVGGGLVCAAPASAPLPPGYQVQRIDSPMGVETRGFGNQAIALGDTNGDGLTTTSSCSSPAAPRAKRASSGSTAVRRGRSWHGQQRRPRRYER